MTREQLLEKSLESLREIAKAQGVKSLTRYRKAELADIIMNGGVVQEKYRQKYSKRAANFERQPAFDFPKTEETDSVSKTDALQYGDGRGESADEPAPLPGIKVAAEQDVLPQSGPYPETDEQRRAKSKPQQSGSQQPGSDVRPGSGYTLGYSASAPAPKFQQGGYQKGYGDREQGGYNPGGRESSRYSRSLGSGYAPRRGVHRSTDGYAQGGDYRQRGEYVQSDFQRGGDFGQGGARQQSYYGQGANYPPVSYQQGYNQPSYPQGYNQPGYPQNYPQGYQQEGYNPQYTPRDYKQDSYYNSEYGTSNPAVPEMIEAGECSDGEGILEIMADGYGFLISKNAGAQTKAQAAENTKTSDFAIIQKICHEWQLNHYKKGNG